MAAQREGLVVGVFDEPAAAERAVAALRQAWFAHDRIDMVTRDQGAVTGTPRLAIQKDAAEGALAGAATGAGAVAGALAMLLVPGLGTVLGGGLLLGALGGAALGAAGGTFLGPFVALEMNEEEAHHYSRHVEEGRTVVLVHAGARADEAGTILRQQGAASRHEYAAAPQA
jgi:hypothetical protein